MNSAVSRFIVLAASLSSLVACDATNTVGPDPLAQPATFTATGDIAARVEEFRVALGGPSNGGTAGQQESGRREISWDGAGANQFNNKNDFPASFFNTNVRSGAVFTTPGTGFRNDSLAFSEINASYAAEFGTFSPTKIFSPVGSNLMDVFFQVAGQPTPALVTGFGAVFSDVDLADNTRLEYFDANGMRLAAVSAPNRTDAAGLSFAGAVYPVAVIARVRITLGTGALSPTAADVSTGGAADVVVTDNFIYGEPRRLPL